jgi:hypothetical protein
LNQTINILSINVNKISTENRFYKYEYIILSAFTFFEAWLFSDMYISTVTLYFARQILPGMAPEQNTLQDINIELRHIKCNYQLVWFLRGFKDIFT